MENENNLVMRDAFTMALTMFVSEISEVKYTPLLVYNNTVRDRDFTYYTLIICEDILYHKYKTKIAQDEAIIRGEIIFLLRRLPFNEMNQISEMDQINITHLIQESNEDSFNKNETNEAYMSNNFPYYKEVMNFAKYYLNKYNAYCNRDYIRAFVDEYVGNMNSIQRVRKEETI